MTEHAGQADLWIETTPEGRILDWCADALELIGYSARAAEGRWLPLQFVKNRPREAHLIHALLGHPVERHGTIRPRDRREVQVSYRIALADHSTKLRPVLRWTFQKR